MPRRIIDLGRIHPACVASRHGTDAAYRYGCRCPHGRDRNRVNNKRRREGRYVSPLVDATGTTRRIRALCAMGWRYTDLAVRLDCSWQRVQQLALAVMPTVHVDTRTRVRSLCYDLSAIPGPSRLSAGRSAAKGWVTFARWVDIDDPSAVPLPGRAKRTVREPRMTTDPRRDAAA